jgi:hypothetical protein
MAISPNISVRFVVREKSSDKKISPRTVNRNKFSLVLLLEMTNTGKNYSPTTKYRFKKSNAFALERKGKSATASSPRRSRAREEPAPET